MSDSPFPPEIPKLGDLLRVRPYKAEYVTHHYKDFCEEAYVASRFFAIDYEGNPVVSVSLGGQMLTEPLRYNPQNQMWLNYFDGQDRIVEVEVVLQ